MVVSNAIEKVHEAVKEGESIVSPMKPPPSSPPWSSRWWTWARKPANFPEMLLKVADVYDDEVDSAVTALTSILEPVMIVILALVVGSVVFALFMPLIKIIQDMGKGS